MKTIVLTQGKVALVDDEDFEKVNQFKWYASKDKNTYYAKRVALVKGKRKTVAMHRWLMGAQNEDGENLKPGIEVDHWDKNGLNNQKQNLRFPPKGCNKANSRKSEGKSSIYKGVNWDKAKKKWRAQIKKNNKKIYLGIFQNEKSAARAYDKAAFKYFGEFSSTNFPKSGY
jgi:hypothetical protein